MGGPARRVGEQAIRRVTEGRADDLLATTVDVVVGYTNGYAARLGGQSQAQTRLDYLIALANNAYADSLVDGQLRLVRAVQVNYPDNTSNTSTLFQLTGVSCVASNTGANRLPHQGSGAPGHSSDMRFNGLRPRLVPRNPRGWHDAGRWCNGHTLARQRRFHRRMF